jgi:hypothetical protein
MPDVLSAHEDFVHGDKRSGGSDPGIHFRSTLPSMALRSWVTRSASCSLGTQRSWPRPTSASSSRALVYHQSRE